MSFGKSAFYSLIIILLIGPQLANGASLSEKLITLNTRDGVTQSFSLIVPEKPTATVLLFAGGDGKVKFKKSGSGVKSSSNNFLVRTRHNYADAGMAVATVEVPSDMNDGINALFRMSEEHVIDIKQVVADLKQRLGLPVWLIGTSMGSFSVANGAMTDGIDGLILTSSITRSAVSWSIFDSHPRGILNMPMNKITVPTFVLAHKDDGCDKTPAGDVPDIVAALPNAKSVQSNILKGGKPPKSKPCNALSQHGFYGIEKEAVKNILNFINAHNK